MWPIPNLDHDLCTVSFSPDSVTCSWIQKTSNGLACPSKLEKRSRAPLTVRAYKRYQLDNLELQNLILFNPTTIKKYITSFLAEHNKTDAFIAFSLDGPAITEHYVALPTSTPHRADFGIVNSSSVLWDYRYLYPNDHGQFVFYVYTVPRSLILQYQLLAVAAQCNLIAMTTKSMALLTTYQHVFGSAFRRSQLAVDMMRHNNNIDQLVSVDILKRMVQVPTTIRLQDECSYIAAACGLFFEERVSE
jgi:hypothetical protein